VTHVHWTRPEKHPSPPHDGVHVWRIALGTSPGEYAAYRQTLSGEERQRADRYRSERARSYYIAARAVLRCILAGYLGNSPAELRFSYNRQGKPRLFSGDDDPRLEFNLSHASGLALLAVTTHGPVGIDLEFCGRRVEIESLAQRYFSKAESRHLMSLPAFDRRLAFFRCWTRKEAFLKACGGGLAMGLNRFEVSLLPGRPGQVLPIRGELDAVQGWWLQALYPAPRFVAALAARGRDWGLRGYQWPGPAKISLP